METKFNFKSQICTTKEQSERLLALGLKKETADMALVPLMEWDDCTSQAYFTGIYVARTKEDVERYNLDYYINAWSLYRLIKIIPKCVRAHSIGDDSPRLHPYTPKFDYRGVTIENIDETLVDFYQHTDLFDNIIECIEWLINEGYFNKEYLEEL